MLHTDTNIEPDEQLTLRSGNSAIHDQVMRLCTNRPVPDHEGTTFDIPGATGMHVKLPINRRIDWVLHNHRAASIIPHHHGEGNERE